MIVFGLDAGLTCEKSHLSPALSPACLGGDSSSNGLESSTSQGRVRQRRVDPSLGGRPGPANWRNAQPLTGLKGWRFTPRSKQDLDWQRQRRKALCSGQRVEKRPHEVQHLQHSTAGDFKSLSGVAEG